MIYHSEKQIAYQDFLLFLIITFFGFVFLHYYAFDLSFTTVDGAGFYKRATNEIPNQFEISNMYFFLSELFSYFLIIPYHHFVIVTLNFIFLVTSVYIFSVFLKSKYKLRINSFVYFIFICTPVSFNYSFYFGKEPFLFLIYSISLFLLHHLSSKFNFIYLALLIPFVFVGSSLRPYFFIHLFALSYFFIYSRHEFRLRYKIITSPVTLFFALILSIFVFTYLTNTTFLSFLYYFGYNAFGFLFSPNPANLFNLSAYPIETFISIIFLSIIFIRLITLKPISLPFIILVLFYTAPVSAVISHMNSIGLTDAYGVFFTRTRFPIYSFLFLFYGSLYIKKLNFFSYRRL